jgi:hypothetical protein
MKKILLSLTAIATISGCASSSKNVATSYVSPMQYQSYSCEQVAAEMGRVTSRVNELGGRLDKAAEADAAITGIGLIIFWPALFALGGTKQQEADYARYKGEYEALTQISVQKNCMASQASIATMPAPTSLTIEAAAKACEDLGVKPGTEKFGQCTLKLSGQPTAPAAASTSPEKMSIENAAKKCSDIGLKPGTEEFGQCTLKLSR